MRKILNDAHFSSALIFFCVRVCESWHFIVPNQNQNTMPTLIANLDGSYQIVSSAIITIYVAIVNLHTIFAFFLFRFFVVVVVILFAFLVVCLAWPGRIIKYWLTVVTF